MSKAGILTRLWIPCIAWHIVSQHKYDVAEIIYQKIMNENCRRHLLQSISTRVQNLSISLYCRCSYTENALSSLNRNTGSAKKNV